MHDTATRTGRTEGRRTHSGGVSYLVRELVVLGPVLLGVLDHLVDLVRRETSVLSLDLRASLGPGDRVLRGHGEDAVGVQSERHLHLGGGGDAIDRITESRKKGKLANSGEVQMKERRGVWGKREKTRG